MIHIVDLFHQQIMDDPDYMVLADYNGGNQQGGGSQDTGGLEP